MSEHRVSGSITEIAKQKLVVLPKIQVELPSFILSC